MGINEAIAETTTELSDKIEPIGTQKLHPNKRAYQEISLEERHEIEEAARCLVKLRRAKLDPKTFKELRDQVKSTTTQNEMFLESPSVTPRRMSPTTRPLPCPQIKQREIVNENEAIFEADLDFIEKLNQGVVCPTKLPPLGEAIDGIVLPSVPPIETLQGKIGKCDKPFEKQLTESDLKQHYNRLDFCKDMVENILKKFMIAREYNQVTSEQGLEVIVYDRAGRTYDMKFKLWSGGKCMFCREGGTDFAKKISWRRSWIGSHFGCFATRRLISSVLPLFPGDFPLIT